MISAGMISGGEDPKPVSGQTTSGLNVTLGGFNLNDLDPDSKKKVGEGLANMFANAGSAPLYAAIFTSINETIRGAFAAVIASMQFTTQENLGGTAKEMKADDNRTQVTLADIAKDMNKETTASNNKTTADVARINGSYAEKIADRHEKGETERASLARVDDIFNGRPSRSNGWTVD